MAVLIEGAVDHLKVTGRNKAGRIVPLVAPVTIGVTQPDGTAALGGPTVAADGTFDFNALAPDGDYTLVATDGTLTSAPYVETVQADNTVSALVIEPA